MQVSLYMYLTLCVIKIECYSAYNQSRKYNKFSIQMFYIHNARVI